MTNVAVAPWLQSFPLQKPKKGLARDRPFFGVCNLPLAFLSSTAAAPTTLFLSRSMHSSTDSASVSPMLARRRARGVPPPAAARASAKVDAAPSLACNPRTRQAGRYGPRTALQPRPTRPGHDGSPMSQRQCRPPSRLSKRVSRPRCSRQPILNNPTRNESRDTSAPLVSTPRRYAAPRVSPRAETFNLGRFAETGAPRMTSLRQT
jgi:hypothetical protein